MAITASIRENGIKGDSDSRTVEYIVRGATDFSDDEADALDYMTTTGSPATWDGIPRIMPIAIEPVIESPPVWIATVSYKPFQPNNPESGDVDYEFEIGTESVHIQSSLETIQSVALPGKTAPNFHKLINVQPDGDVEGTDILVPTCTFSYTLTQSAAFFSSAYIDKVEGMVGKTNSQTFNGRAIGTTLFMGASGRINSSGQSSLTLKFARGVNQTSLTIGDLSGINKKAWEYLWVWHGWKKDTGAKRTIHRPEAAYVERVYDADDLNNLFV